jgi:hypothetical protein
LSRLNHTNESEIAANPWAAAGAPKCDQSLRPARAPQLAGTGQNETFLLAPENQDFEVAPVSSQSPINTAVGDMTAAVFVNL